MADSLKQAKRSESAPLVCSTPDAFYAADQSLIPFSSRSMKRPTSFPAYPKHPAAHNILIPTNKEICMRTKRDFATRMDAKR